MADTWHPPEIINTVALRRKYVVFHVLEGVNYGAYFTYSRVYEFHSVFTQKYAGRSVSASRSKYGIFVLICYDAGGRCGQVGVHDNGADAKWPFGTICEYRLHTCVPCACG